MTKKEKLTKLHKFAKELLMYYNKALLVDSGLDILDLPDDLYDFHDSLCKIGIEIETLLMEAEVSLKEGGWK
jgi:hypothetical protein